MNKQDLYSKEECRLIALKYPTRNQLFLNNITVYNIIKKNKWENEMFSHMKFYIQKPANYWNYERCKETALLYNRRKDLESNHISCYNRIVKNKWFELFNHMEVSGNKFKRLIYVYIFPDNHVYVGLTCNMNDRNGQHLNRDHDSAVYLHKQLTGLEPKKEILTDYIEAKEAVKMERYYIEYYKNLDYKLLNKGRGGQLGGSTIKWTHEKIKEVVLLCPNLKKFRKEYSGAYKTMIKNNWVDDFYPNRKKNKPYIINNNYEECKKIALSYNNKSKLHKENYSIYKSCEKNGWLDEFFPKKITIEWTYEKIKEIASLFKYKSEFQRNYVGGYDKALKLGIINELFPENLPFIIERKIWTFDEIKKLIEDNNYSRTLLLNKHMGAYRTAKENNWLDILLPLKNKKAL